MPPARRRPWRVLAAVLVAHGLLLALLATSRPDVVARQGLAPPAPRMAVVRLPALPPRSSSPVTDTPPPLTSERAPSPRAPLQAPLRPSSRPAAMSPVFERPTAMPPAEPDGAAPRPAGSTAPPGPAAPDVRQGTPGIDGAERAAPLWLDLPPQRGPAIAPSPAQQAVERQAGGQPRLSAEARLARRLETTWTEENLGDGRLRLRRGDNCVILKETTASQLDPWNNRGPAPRGATPCP